MLKFGIYNSAFPLLIEATNSAKSQLCKIQNPPNTFINGRIPRQKIISFTNQKYNLCTLTWNNYVL